MKTKHLFAVKARLESFFAAKRNYKYGGRFSLQVGYKIQPCRSSTNQNAALIIDH